MWVVNRALGGKRQLKCLSNLGRSVCRLGISKAEQKCPMHAFECACENVIKGLG